MKNFILALVTIIIISIGCDAVGQKSGPNLPESEETKPVPVVTEAKISTSHTVEIDGHRITAPAGSRVTVTTEEVTHGKDKGPGIKSTADVSNLDMTGDSPGMTFDKWSIGQGRMSLVSKLATSKNSGMTTLMIIGGLMVAGGIVLIIVTQRLVLGSAIAIGGISLIGIAVISTSYPWVWALAFLVLAGIGVYMIIDSKNKERLAKMGKAVVGGIELSTDYIKERLAKMSTDGKIDISGDKINDVAEAMQGGIKESIADTAGNDGKVVKAVVTEIKNTNGFH
jgi:hypothetical protein